MNVIDRLIFHKQDPVFDMAKDLLCQVKEKFKNPDKSVGLNIPEDKWIPIFKDHELKDGETSPEMFCTGEGMAIFIRFDENSKPYSDNFTNKVKNCILIFGNLFDENNPGNVMVPGRSFKVYPHDKVRPYTKDNKALAVITLSDK